MRTPQTTCEWVDEADSIAEAKVSATGWERGMDCANRRYACVGTHHVGAEKVQRESVG